MLSDHFPAVTTLSLREVCIDDVGDLEPVLDSRFLINAVYADMFCGVLEELRDVYDDVYFETYVPLDIFANDF